MHLWNQTLLGYCIKNCFDCELLSHTSNKLVVSHVVVHVFIHLLGYVAVSHKSFTKFDQELQDTNFNTEEFAIAQEWVESLLY